MEPVVFLVGVAVGVAIGAWAYRRALKKDPAKLEALAQKIKNLGADK